MAGPQSRATWPQRWARERQRSPEIRRIKIGQTIEREYKGTVHQATNHRGFWTYDGGEYPTLYEVTQAICGAREYPRGDNQQKTRRMSDYSASRFWKLKPRGKKNA